jgi:hypothetical protein
MSLVAALMLLLVCTPLVLAGLMLRGTMNSWMMGGWSSDQAAVTIIGMLVFWVVSTAAVGLLVVWAVGYRQ